MLSQRLRIERFAEQIRVELQKGTEILKTARLCGTGVSAVRQIKPTMKQTV
jgi:hypothetical protein